MASSCWVCTYGRGGEGWRGGWGPNLLKTFPLAAWVAWVRGWLRGIAWEAAALGQRSRVWPRTWQKVQYLGRASYTTGWRRAGPSGREISTKCRRSSRRPISTSTRA
jgi:hypothetical protein